MMTFATHLQLYGCNFGALRSLQKSFHVEKKKYRKHFEAALTIVYREWLVFSTNRIEKKQKRLSKL